MLNLKKVSVYDIAIFSMVAKGFVDASGAIPSSQIIDVLCVGAYIISIVFLIVKKRYTLNTLILIGMVSLVLLYTSAKTGYSDPMISFLCIVAIKGKDFNTIVNKILKYYLLMFMVHFLLTIVGAFLGNVRLSIVNRGVLRYTLGFVHPNTTGAKFFVLLVLLLWNRFKRIKWAEIISLFVLETIVYYICKSRTAYILSIIALILFPIAQRPNVIIQKLFTNIAKFIFPATAIGIYVVTVLYQKGNIIGILINKGLTGRINMAAYAMNRVGFTLLGREIDFYGRLSSYSYEYSLHSFTFDCVYSFIFCSMGLVYLAVLSLLFFQLACKKNVLVNVGIILWALNGITEVTCLNGFNFFPIFCLSFLLSDRIFRQKKQQSRAIIRR